MPRTHDYHDFYALLDALIDFNLVYQKRFESEFKEVMGAIPFATEFQTVGIELPRRSGKSTYIANRATEEDVILVAHAEMRNMFVQGYAPRARVLYVEQDVIAKPVRRVYIDEPRLCGDLRKLIRPFAGRAQQYILLGTP